MTAAGIEPAKSESVSFSDDDVIPAFSRDTGVCACSEKHPLHLCQLRMINAAEWQKAVVSISQADRDTACEMEIFYGWLD